MEELNKWIDASLVMIKAALAEGAPPDMKARAASVCVSLHGMLSPTAPNAPPPAPVLTMVPPVAEPDLFDLIMARLAAVPEPTPLDLPILGRGR